jgi:hypothetical protein
MLVAVMHFLIDEQSYIFVQSFFNMELLWYFLAPYTSFINNSSFILKHHQKSFGDTCYFVGKIVDI